MKIKSFWKKTAIHRMDVIQWIAVITALIKLISAIKSLFE